MSAIDFVKITALLQDAKKDGREFLLEPEGMAVLEAMGIPIPRYVFLKNIQDFSAIDLAEFSQDRVVVKIVSPQILHKSDVGGVKILPKDARVIQETLASWEQKFQNADIRGFTINEFIPYDATLGGEILIGMRWTQDCGPVVTYGAGGIYTEFLAKNFISGRDVAIISPELVNRQNLEEQIRQVAITSLIAGELRGQKPRLDLEKIIDVLMKFVELATVLVPEEISEFEVNPFVISHNTLIPLDVLVKISASNPQLPVERPIYKIRNLLKPESIAIIGVSESLNVGHIILNNIIQSGFNRDLIYVVKPGTETIEGCKCYPNVESIPGTVDLFVFSLSAAQFPPILETIVSHKKAESIIVIAGGLEEKTGTEETVAKIRSLLLTSRQSGWYGPIINGGNCLGIRSQPGNYDTFFIPQYKLPFDRKQTHPVALISQSGGFACSKASKVSINPKYVISLGNQMDLTVGDFLNYLKEDPEIEVFAVYMEGFKLLDGLKFFKAVKEITSSGRTVIFYQAGRTVAGAKASASHTASIAGDYAVVREMAKNAGAIVVESIADFEELIEVFAMLSIKQVRGLRLAGISNAGFINVATADNLGNFDFASFEMATISQLTSIFETCKLENIIDIHNPVDVTGIMSDQPYAETIEAVLQDKNIDVGIISCVPVVGVLSTLAPSSTHAEDIFQESSLPVRLVQLWRKTDKAWVIVVDGGVLYEPMAQLFKESGIPTFRAVDRAARIFNIFCNEQIRKTQKP